MDYKTLERDYVKFLEVMYDYKEKKYIESNKLSSIYSFLSFSYDTSKNLT